MGKLDAPASRLQWEASDSKKHGQKRIYPQYHDSGFADTQFWEITETSTALVPMVEALTPFWQCKEYKSWILVINGIGSVLTWLVPLLNFGCDLAMHTPYPFSQLGFPAVLPNLQTKTCLFNKLCLCLKQSGSVSVACNLAPWKKHYCPFNFMI